MHWIVVKDKGQLVTVFVLYHLLHNYARLILLSSVTYLFVKMCISNIYIILHNKQGQKRPLDTPKRMKRERRRERERKVEGEI